MILTSFATKNKNSRENLSWTHYCGWSGDKQCTISVKLQDTIYTCTKWYRLWVSSYGLASWISGLPISPMAILVVIALMYLIGGCVVEALPLIIITVPIFFPVVQSLGFDPIWFGVIIVLLGQVGMITPPVGINVFVIAGVAKDIPLQTIFRGVVPFVLAMIICIIILMIFPKITLFLPNLMR